MNAAFVEYSDYLAFKTTDQSNKVCTKSHHNVFTKWEFVRCL